MHSIVSFTFMFGSFSARLLLRASCTLEAGVKIYSLRVDSVHSEAYKVLGGINRAGQDNEEGLISYKNLV